MPLIYQIELPYNSQSGNYTIATSDFNVIYTGTGGNTFTLPSVNIATVVGKIFQINHQGTRTLTINGNGSDTINGNLTFLLYSQESLTVQSISSGWVVL